MKPTVIKSGDQKGQAAKATVIQTQTSPTEPALAQARKPTVMSSSPAPSPSPKVVNVVTPTAVPGIRRMRISVSLPELEKQNPSVKPAVLDKARSLILAVCPESMTESEAVLWGNEIQQKYAGLVNDSLSLSQSEVLTKVSGHLNRMLTILGQMDLKKICGLEGSNGTFSRLIKKATACIDSMPEFENAQKELNQLLQLMNARLKELLALREKLDNLSSKINETGNEAEASAIASAFIAEYIKKQPEMKGGNLSQRFLERSMSLTQTLGQIRSNSSTMGMQIEQPLRLITAVQDTALVMVPGWIGSIVAIKTMIEGRQKPTVTEVGELGDQMQKIIQKLKER